MQRQRCSKNERTNTPELIPETTPARRVSTLALLNMRRTSAAKMSRVW